MIAGQRVLAIIPARGGSKGVPRKNLRKIGGRPLIGWTIKAAQASQYIDRIVVSSDDDEICQAADSYGPQLSLRRPAEFATDEASSLDVVLHALQAAPGHGIGILLQPTSPLRTTADIDAGLSLMTERGGQSCVAVSAATDSPYWMFRLGTGDQLNPLLAETPPASRRQDLPAFYVPNGALYAFRSDWLAVSGRFIDQGTIGYVMPESRSLDIDTEADILRAKQVLEGHTE